MRSDPSRTDFSRRTILKTVSCGFGYLAFAGLASHAALAADTPMLTKAAQLPARAKRVIFLSMRGGPSHVDTFDHKPKLVTDTGLAGRRLGTKLLGSKWKFTQHGQSGLWFSELFPNLAKHADDLCSIHSMQTDFPAHPQAFLQMHTGSAQFVRPSLGAWTLYGLGNLSDNVPGFVTLSPPSDLGGAQNYGSAFLTAKYQTTRTGAGQRPIASAAVRHLKRTCPEDQQRAALGLIQEMNREMLARDGVNPDVDRIFEHRSQAVRLDAIELAFEAGSFEKRDKIGANAGEGRSGASVAAVRKVSVGLADLALLMN